jgi:hypothetical protein
MPSCQWRATSGAALVDVRLDVVPLRGDDDDEGHHHHHPVLPRRLWRVVSWVGILLDVIGGLESVMWEGCPRTTTGDSQCWFSGQFRQVFFNTISLPRINIGDNVWGESSIMTGVYQHWCSSTLHIGWGL